MKNKKQLFLSLCCALMLSTLPVGAASCDKFEDVFGGNKEEEKFDQYAGGEFYCGGNDEAASGANTLSITDSETVTMVINGETLTGTYKFKGDTFTMTFGEKTATAKLTENGVNLTYEGVEYAFIPKVNYTVTYKIGEETKTQTVVNGRPLSKPADPAVDGFMFMGWYADSSFETPFAFNQAITADTTVYAKFIELDEEAQAFTVKFMVDGAEAFAAVKTEAGVVLNLPTPEKEGATFAGWWVSDTEDAEKLTYKYEHQILKQNTTLFAVWESDAPLVSVNANGVTWTAKGVNNSYFVEIDGPNGEEDSGFATMASYDYDFASKPAGEYRIRVTLNNQKTTVYYMNKALARVCNFMVEDSKLIFNAVENATKYLITSECGTASHVHNKVDNGNSTVYDFSNCAMKEGGITFIVEAVADGCVSSVSKVFTFEQTLPAPEVSVDTATDFIKWNAVENATSYDVEINGVVVKENTTATSFDVRNYGVGALNVKVTAKAHGWNAISTEYVYNKTSLPVPANVKLTASTLTWDAVEGAELYKVKIGDQEKTALSNSFELTADLLPAGASSCAIQVRAISLSGGATSSAYGDAVTVQFGTMADTLTYLDGKVHWDAVVNVKGYEVEFNGVATTVAADQTSYALNFTDAGQNVIRVRCIKMDDAKSAWVDLYVTSYKTEFKVGKGNVKPVPAVYHAEGDEVDLSAVVQRAGYTFDGWFDTEDGIDGIQYGKTVAQGASNLTVYAHWTANKYKVTLVTESGDLSAQEVEVTFNENYKLPYIVSGGPDGMTFAGWYTQMNGRGTKYADERGNGVQAWWNTGDVTLIANWVAALEYHEVTNEETGEKAYEVVGGKDIQQLTVLRIPETYNGKPVISIGGSAFAGCGSLKKIELPDTIQTINMGSEGGLFGTGSAFLYCYALREFEVYETEGNHDRFYETIDGVLVYNNPVYGKELVFAPSRMTDEFIVPEGVESIPVNMFKSSTLERIVLPSTLKTIADYAFDDAYKLKELVFADAEQPLAEDDSNALVIGNFAFQACYELKEITLPARTAELTGSVTFANIFNRSSALQKINIATPTEGESVYTSANGIICNAAGDTMIFCSKYRTGELAIPATIKTIAASAFEGCGYIEKLTVHAFVSEIGENAFNGCKSMKSVVFEGQADDAAINIASKAFYATGLLSVDLPKNLGKLEAYAFGSSSALTKVVADIPATAEVAEAAFGSQPADSKSSSYFYVTTLTLGATCPEIKIAGVFGGEKLLTVDVHSANPYYMADKNSIIYNKVIGEDGVPYPTKVLYCPSYVPEAYMIPETIEEIGADVFKGKGFKQVTIGAKVKTIGNNAFASCDNLEMVIFMDSNVELAADGSNGLKIGNNAFDYCKKLSTITLPERLVSIGSGAFDGCSSLKGRFVIPDEVKSIGDSAFNGCSNITSVKLPANLATLGSSSSATTGMLVFDGCTKLASITIDAANKAFKTIDGVLYKVNGDGEPIELVYCPLSCTGKQMEIDGEMKNVIQVPSTVTAVWSYAFKNVVTIDVVEFATAEDTSVTINKNAFTGANIGSVILPEGLKKIATGTFSGAGIQSITIPESVTSIEYEAFKDCTLLESVYFVNADAEMTDDNKLTLGQEKSRKGPFYGCSSLKNIVLPERTTLIGYQTFYGCKSLESIAIPKHITKIYGQTFYNATSLTSIEFKKNANGETAVTVIDAAAFRNTGFTSFVIPDSVTTLGGAAFVDTKLTSIHIPAAVTTLGGAFKENTKLQEITFAAGSQLTSIANNEFSGCTALRSISIPSSVQTIGFWIFKNCSKLQSVKFETNEEGKMSVASIGKEIFLGTALTELILPETTADTLTLGNGLFNGCRKLTTVSIPSQVESLAGVFDGCASIKNLKIAEANTDLVLKDGVVYNSDETIMQLVMKDIATETLYIPDTITSIAAGAFANQPSIKTVSLPASIQSIGSGAFENCYNLTSVEFRESYDASVSLSELPSYLFNGCTSLTTITGIPETVKTIGSYAFQDCTSLKAFDIPETITAISDYAFAYSGLETIAIPATVTVLNRGVFTYCTSLTSVSFAEEDTLTKIVNFAFEGCTALASFDMPDSVTMVNYGAFAGSGIKSIHLSTALTQLDGGTFENCAELISVELPEGLVKLDYNMFKGCSKLGMKDEENGINGYVKLPSSLTTISYGVFQDCTSLVEITIPEKVTRFAEGGSWNTTGRRPSIRNSKAFMGCTSLTTVNLNNVTQLGHDAFNGCTSLVNIDLSKVTDMNDNVFFGCTSLTAVDLSALKTPRDNDFEGCYNLETVVLGDSLITIEDRMFANCMKLANIEIPSSVTTINGSAFLNCRALTKMTLPVSVTKLPTSIFDGCTNLEEVNIQGPVTSIGDFAFRGCEKITEFTIPSGLTSALGNRFLAGTSVETITIPKAYGKIWTSGNSAPFAGCETLKTILVENGNATFKSVDGVLYDLNNVVRAVPNAKTFDDDTFVVNAGEDVGYMAFAGCTNVKKVILPNSLTILGDNAFRDCYGLEEVVLGDNLTWIKNWAFQACLNLKKVAKADGTWEGITNISSQAFMGCTSLEEVVLPSTLVAGATATTALSGVFSDMTSANADGYIFESGLKSITIPAHVPFGTAFQNASNLERVVLAEGITEIPQSAFTNCPNLKEVVLPSTLTTINKYAFDGAGVTSIIIPDSVTSILANAFANCTELTSVTLPADLTGLPANVFSGCTKLASIKVMEAVEGSEELVAVEKLPDTLTSIGSSAFAGTAITNIVIPEGVAVIDSSCFKGCASLVSVTIPEGVTSIGANAFAGCTSLQKVVLPSTVTSIGANAFDGCTALESINIPESVYTIGTSAFAGCTKLSSIVIPTTAWVGATAFSGWTAEQTVNVVVNEYVTACVWTAGWNAGTAAKFVFNYTPTV